MSAPSSPRNTLRLIAYGLPALPITMLLAPLYVYLPTFYAQEAGLSLTMAGFVFFAARLWDGLIDPVIGGLSDRTRGRFGARRPWIVAGAPVLMIATYFACMPPEDAGPFYLFAWLVVLYAALTMVQVPHWAWGAEISGDYRERNRVAGFRESFVIFGALLAAVAPLAVLGTGGATLGDTLRVYAFCVMILTPLAIGAAMAFGAREQSGAHARTPITWRGALRSFTSNPPFRRFMLGHFGMSLGYSSFNSLMVLFVDYGLGLQGMFLQFLFFKQITAILCIPIVLRLARIMDKHKLLWGGGVVLALGLCFLYLMPSGSLVWAAFGAALIGVASAPLVTLAPSLLADVADYGAVQSKETHTGAYYAVFGMAQKVAYALGVAIGLSLLDLSPFDPQSFGEDSASAVRRVALIIPIGIILVSALAFVRFPIDKARHDAIKKTLADMGMGPKMAAAQDQA